MQETATQHGSIIYLEDVTVDYDGFKALQDLTFFMDFHELRVVIGPNGAGKTTLLDVISGKVRPSSGRVIFGKGTDLLRLREHDIVALGVARKFQSPTLFPQLSVSENLELSLRQERGVFATLWASLTATQHDTLASILDTIGLAHKALAKAASLSHGEKQWLEIGMVMAQDPQLLLIDEPVAGMTTDETERTGALLESIAQHRAVLVIEHDMEFVRQIAKKVTVLHEGHVLCEGTVDQVQRDPRVREIYLGRERTHAPAR